MFEEMEGKAGLLKVSVVNGVLTIDIQEIVIEPYATPLIDPQATPLVDETDPGRQWAGHYWLGEKMPTLKVPPMLQMMLKPLLAGIKKGE